MKGKGNRALKQRPSMSKAPKRSVKQAVVAETCLVKGGGGFAKEADKRRGNEWETGNRAELDWGQGLATGSDIPSFLCRHKSSTCDNKKKKSSGEKAGNGKKRWRAVKGGNGVWSRRLDLWLRLVHVLRLSCRIDDRWNCRSAYRLRL